MTQDEYVRIREHLAAEGLGRACLNAAVADLGDGVRIALCPFRDDARGRCRVYPVRPVVCRLMGHVPWMPCPLDRVPAVVRPEPALAALQEYCLQPRKPYEAWERLGV